MIPRARPERREGRAFVAVLALLAAACGARLMKLPSGPGAPAPDAREALAEATAVCRAVSTMTAEIAVTGSAGGHRMRGRLLAGVAPSASARLEAVAPFGQPFFIFVSRNNDATLLLPREDRVLEHGRPAAVLDAVAGIPIDASDLRATLTGCASTPDVGGARQLGDIWRIIPDGPGDVYLRRDSRWQLVAMVRRDSEGDWRVEYSDFSAGLPRTIRLTSLVGDRFDLTLRLSQVETNVPLDADAFRVQIPRTSQPITIDELRRSGPLGQKADGR